MEIPIKPTTTDIGGLVDDIDEGSTECASCNADLDKHGKARLTLSADGPRAYLKLVITCEECGYGVAVKFAPVESKNFNHG